jgi:hypothetical protein
MRRPALTMAVGAVALVAVVWARPAAAAASISDVGWWSDRPGASAPDGGFVVGTGPQGPVSVAAVRIDLGDGVTGALLSFTESGGVATSTAALAICATGDGWTAAPGAPLAEAPATSCAGTAVAPTRTETTWTADIQALVEDRTGTVSLAIVPASGQGLWEVQFEAPTIVASPVPPERSSTATTARDRPTASEPSGTAEPATAGAVASTATGGPAPSVPGGAAAATSPTTATTVAGDSDEVAFQQVTADDVGDEPDARTLGRVLLFCGIAAAVGTVAGLGRRYATGGV